MSQPPDRPAPEQFVSIELPISAQARIKAAPARPASQPLDVCLWCGRRRAEHYSVNFADGPFVSGETLVCPTAIFKPAPKELKGRAR